MENNIPDKTPSAAANFATSLDLKYYWLVLRRHRWMIAIVFCVLVTAVMVYTLRQPKVYAAQASVIIDVSAPRYLDNQVSDVNTDSYSTYWANKEYYETQLRIITSRVVAQRVVEKLGLDHDAAFLGLQNVKDEKVREAIMKRVDATLILQSKIKVDPIKDSRITNIRVEDLDPDRAALLANEVSDSYAEENMGLKLRTIEKASQWLEERKESLEKTAKTSEMAVYDFKKQSDMLTTSLEDRQNVVSQRLVATNAALTDVRTRIAALKARVDTIRSVQARAQNNDPMWAEALPSVADNQSIREFKTRYVAQFIECSELKQRYFEGHPKLAACLDRLSVTEKDLMRELNNIVLSAVASLEDAQRNERNLNANLEEVKAEAFVVNKKQMDFDRIKRDSDNNQRLYDVVLKRIKDIELSGLLRTSNVRVLDAARPNPVPIKPDVLSTLLIALLAGFFGSFGVAILIESLNSTVDTHQEIEERLQLPFLGLLPSIPLEVDAPANAKDLHMFRFPKSIVAECCRVVRTNLLFMTPDEPFKTMMVTSSGPQEGKSTTVINLGIAMAQSGGRILLVDTDMRRPRLHKAFGVPNDMGVSSLVVGDGTIEQAVKSTEVPNLFVLPCGPIPPNPAELLHTKAFQEMLKKLSERFDRIVLDSPPVGAVADAVVLSTHVHGVLLVLKSRKTQREMARRTLRALRDVKAKMFGAVLNDVDLERSAYGQYYGYGYKYYGYSSDNQNPDPTQPTQAGQA